MNIFTSLYKSYVGKKVVMSLTGIFLCTFLIVHLFGNLALFKNDGGKLFNEYSKFMSTNSFIRVMEIVLFLGIIFHIVSGVLVWFRNRSARIQKYQVYETSYSTFASRMMNLSASVVFLFIVIHLYTFFVPTRFYGDENSYKLVVDAFKNPIYSSFYVVAIFILAIHLKHGFQSAFQTFGIKEKKYALLIDLVAILFWFIVPLGFISIPLYFLFGGK